MKIAIVIGHEPKQQGAKMRGVNISEYAFWWTFINFALLPSLIKETKHSYKVFERTTMEFGYTKKMILLHKEVDNWGADLAVSFHFNSSSSAGATGFEVLYSGYEPSGRHGQLLLDSLEKALPMLPNRGLKKLKDGDNGYAFVKLGRANALIAEPFFGSNKRGYYRLNNMRSGLVEFLKKI